MRRARTLTNIAVININIVIGLALVLCFVTVRAQDRSPDTGFKAANSYSISEIENVNLSNGNLMLTIPLASLPAGRGTSPGFSVSLHYNSKMWASKQDLRTDGVGGNPGDQFYNRELLVPNDNAGWTLNTGGYSLKLIDRLDLEREAQCVEYFGADEYRRNAFRYKLVLTLPNGDTREFKPHGNSEYPGYPNGFFSLDPWQVRHTNSYTPGIKGGHPNCSTTAELEPAPGVDYFTDDGSQLRMSVPYQPGVGVPQMRFTLYLPDGQIVENKPADDASVFQRVTDRNGNKLVWRAATVNGYNGYKIEDDLLRYIFVGTDRVIQPGVGGTLIETVFSWTTKYVNRRYRATTAVNANPIYLYADLFQPIGVIGQITLPAQAGSRQFTFTYNAADSPPGGYTNGWGELKSITLPDGATADYSYSLDGNSSIELQGFNIIANSAQSRQLSYQTEYDGQTVAATPEVTTYAAAQGAGSSTSPDGRVQFQYSAVGGELNGYVYRTTQTVASMPNGGSMTERIWVAKRPSGTGPDIQIEPIVKTEFTSIPDAGGNPVLTAIKDYEYDQNGNVLEVKEYDWVAYSSIPRTPSACSPAVDEFLPAPRPCGLPAGLTLKRKTVNTYYYETPNILTQGPNSPYYHSDPFAPKLLHLLKSSEVSDANSTVVSRTENYYDGGTSQPQFGNLTETKTWDSTKGALCPPDSNGSRLYACPSNNFVSTSAIYGQYGNPTQMTDPKGVQTVISYDSNNLFPIQTITANNYPSIRRTSAAAYDFYTGLVTSVTDVDNNATTSTGYDALGRPTSATAPNGASTSTEYDDIGRKVITRSDIHAAGDQKKVVVQYFDQLGRVRLARTLEDALTQDEDDPCLTVYTPCAGIKVQTRYRVSNPNSYQLTSNPYRANYSYNAGAEETMGWTLSQSENTGKHSYVTTFAGAALPSPWGGNGSSTGTVQSDHDANATTVTDQAGKPRRAIFNVFGQLARVDEPNNAGQLDSSPGTAAQSTSFVYDALGNLTSTIQGGQSRSYVYSSLSRVLSSQNPESGNVATTYDSNGNITTQRDSRGIKTIFDFDALNRITKKCFRVVGMGALGATSCTQAGGEPVEQNTSDVTYTYDEATVPYSRGRMTKVENGVSTTEFNAFDPSGNVLSHRQIVDTNIYPTSYTYNISGELLEQTYPSGRVVKNTFESDGDLAQILSKKSTNQVFIEYAGQFNYSPSGRVTSMRLGNSAWESVQLNSRLQPTQVALGTTANGADLWKINYEFGELQANGTVDPTKNNSNIGKQIITVPTIGQASGFNATQTFVYDPLNRLKIASETVNSIQSWKQTFNYDRFGNRTFDAVNTTTLGSCPTTVCNPAINTSDNRISGGQGYTIDGVGNVTQNADNAKFVYDALNKAVEVRNASTNALISKNYYDGDGTRIKIDENGVTTIFVYDAFDKIVAEYTVNAPVNQTPKVNYLTADLLGTPRVLTDENRQILARRDMTPFGEDITAGTGGRTLAQQYGVVDGVRQKFTGQQRDTSAKLDYFNARHFSFGHGRFISADNFGGKSSNPQSLNLYAYALNNPLKWVDPTGHAPDDPAKECRNCKLDGGNYLYEDGSVYSIGRSVVNVNGDGVEAGPSSVAEKPGPADLPSSGWDFVPAYGTARRLAYNMSCGDNGGCNISRATGNFVMLAWELSPLGEAAWQLSLARNAFTREILGGADSIGQGLVRNAGDDVVETGVQANRSQGLAFEEKILAQQTDPHVARNVMVKTESGTKTQIDIMTRNRQATISCLECKSSATAQLTRNQNRAHPEIFRGGGTVVGKGKPGFPRGTRIPPGTKVRIVRP